MQKHDVLKVIFMFRDRVEICTRWDGSTRGQVIISAVGVQEGITEDSPCKLTVLKALQGPIKMNIKPERELLWHFSKSPDGVQCTHFIW